jgi:hypothetical protein
MSYFSDFRSRMKRASNYPMPSEEKMREIAEDLGIDIYSSDRNLVTLAIRAYKEEVDSERQKQNSSIEVKAETVALSNQQDVQDLNESNELDKAENSCEPEEPEAPEANDSKTYQMVNYAKGTLATANNLSTSELISISNQISDQFDLESLDFMEQMQTITSAIQQYVTAKETHKRSLISRTLEEVANHVAQEKTATADLLTEEFTKVAQVNTALEDSQKKVLNQILNRFKP